MLTSEINPFVRFARKNESAFTGDIFSAFDHRIFYCVKGHADVFIGKNKYSITDGSVIFWRSPLKYRVVCAENTEITGCNFDFTQLHSDIALPVVPIPNDDCKPYENISFDDAPAFNSHFALSCAYTLKNMFLHLAEEYDCKQIYYAQKCSAILKEILIECLRLSQTNHVSKSAQLAEAVLDFIRQNHSRRLSNSIIGEHFCYHSNYINSLVIRHTGKSMHKYLLEYRINSAIGLMQSQALSISDVADKVGFADVKHFSKAFKAVTGVPPSLFRTQTYK